MGFTKPEQVPLVPARAAEDREFLVFVVQGKRSVVVASSSRGRLGLAVKALQLVLFEHDVEDARHAIGIVFGRGVGDDFHAVNGARRNLFEEGVLRRAGQSGGPAIDKNLYLRRPPKAHVSIDVHGYRGHVHKQFTRRTACS